MYFVAFLSFFLSCLSKEVLRTSLAGSVTWLHDFGFVVFHQNRENSVVENEQGKNDNIFRGWKYFRLFLAKDKRKLQFQNILTK